ncbi:uncharacterized protein LOC135089511 isoform X1 [Scylla paramamosain]|uniref:uncharacterized protein LOC135089511 isoform X1 n=1 Tax=Scylla paramamosain TaxID=85552 RepID=UPI003082A3AE
MSAYPHVRPLKTSKATFKSWLCILGMKTLKAHSYKQREVFHAPFFTTRFCTAWTGLFCPLCLTCLFCFRRDKDSLKVSLKTIAQNFRDRGITFSKFMTRCCLFCMLWLVTDYMHVYSLRILDCTDVMALYSAHVSFVFLLSWMILHDQFVGVRVTHELPLTIVMKNQKWAVGDEITTPGHRGSGEVTPYNSTRSWRTPGIVLHTPEIHINTTLTPAASWRRPRGHLHSAIHLTWTPTCPGHHPAARTQISTSGVLGFD